MHALIIYVVLVYSVSWERQVPVSVLPTWIFVIFRYAFISSFTPTDTALRAIGKQAHMLHSLVFYSFSCVLGSTVGYAYSPDSLAF